MAVKVSERGIDRRRKDIEILKESLERNKRYESLANDERWKILSSVINDAVKEEEQITGQILDTVPFTADLGHEAAKHRYFYSRVKELINMVEKAPDIQATLLAKIARLNEEIKLAEEAL